MKVVIAGGGVTGLAAAYQLTKISRDAGLQVSCVVLEKDSRLGGKITSERSDGFLFEGGPDCFVREKPSVIALAEQLGIDTKLLPTNRVSTGTFVLNNGKLHKLPEGLMLLVPTRIVPFALSPLISWPGKLRMGLDLVMPRSRNAGDVSLAAFVRRRLGQEALDKIGDPLIGGIHGNNPETMSLRASFPRLLDMERDHRSLILAMLAARTRARKAQVVRSGDVRKTYFMSFEGGMIDLVDGLVSGLKEVSLCTGVTVSSIDRTAGRYRVRTKDDSVFDADAVILATPAPDAAAILRTADPVASSELDNIPQASSATINLAFHREDVQCSLDSFGFVISAAEKRKINALTFSSVKWEKRVPDSRYISVRTFVGGGRNQELAELPDEDLVRIAREELHQILGIRGEPVRSLVHHWVRARPQYVLGHLERVSAIEKRLGDRLAGISVAGASYRGVGVPDCVNDGMLAAEKTLDHLRHVHVAEHPKS